MYLIATGGRKFPPMEENSKAKILYGNILARTKDCERIAKNIGVSVEIISIIKGYLFYCSHISRNSSGELIFTRFEPDYEIAASWDRLSNRSNANKILLHDKILIKHEWAEIMYIMKGYSQNEAHILASEEYNYSKALNAYYRSTEIGRRG